MTARYTYLTTDLLTGSTLAEIPFHGVSFDRILNKPGNWQGSTNLDHPLVDNDTMLAGTAPGRTAVYVYRDDQIVWGGIIWSRTYQSQSKSLQMTAQTFESYAYKRIYRPSGTVNYNEAQCSIINKLWTSLQASYNDSIGVLGIAPGSLPSGDVTRTLTVNPWDFKSYGEIIDDPLLNFRDSAEYTIECYEESGAPQKRLALGYPRLGAAATRTGLVIDYPGNILNYYWIESASDSCNRAWATGDGDKSAIKVGVAESASSIASGYPMLERQENHAGVTKQTTIDAHAASDLQEFLVPKIRQTFQIKADEQPEFGSYGIGDDAILQIIDTRFPDPGLDIVVRVVGWNVTPASSEAVEEIDLVLHEEGTE